MKKILAWCLAAALVLPLAACGKGEPAQSAAAGSSPEVPASSAVSEAESQPENEPESQPASSAASSEEEKAASSEAEEENASAASENTPALPADTVALQGGPAQVDAMTFPMGKKVQIEVNGSRRWFAFTTGSGTDYEVWLAPGGQYGAAIGFKIYNRLGELVWESGTNDDGSVTVRQVQLSPQTTYYVAVEQLAGNKGTLIFRVSSHITQSDTAAEIQREPETVEELVFEEPFSLDETQIMFVSNKAIFVDEEAAKAALAPVAEVILAHPDHPILLAGTTATDGEQESCVRLSSQRAEAVKNLLVSAYGVPADQLLTVGLGYAADPFPRGQDRDSKGNFVESEAVKNRRVVVLDANDPTAQAILNA